MFPSITSYKHQMNLKNWFWLTDSVFKNHNFNRFQSFSPFLLVMILLRYDTRRFSSFHVLSSYLHSTHVQYTQYTNRWSIGTNGTIGTNRK